MKKSELLYQGSAHAPYDFHTGRKPEKRGENESAISEKQDLKQEKERKEREWRKWTRSNPPTRSSSWWTSAPKWQRGWHEAPKAPEPGPAAVAANLGVRPLALADHCPPPVASDTDCHAISGDLLAKTTFSFGQFAGMYADTIQAELAQRAWHEVSQASVAQHQVGWQPMYVPHGNAFPPYLPSQLGRE